MDLITVELHCHTCYSSDSLMLPSRLLGHCKQRGIDRVAITDHNEFEGAEIAAEIEPERVIRGEEIMTTQGELLAYFVEERIPPHLSPEETIARLRDQGAVISVAHPYDSIRGGSWNEGDLKRILPLVDALEVFNARTLYSGPNKKAARTAAANGLLKTAGSDAHAYFEVGRTYLRLQTFNDAESFRLALASAEIIARKSSPLVHFFSRYATFRKALGWKPEGPLQPPRNQRGND
jgi:predicted metal-dependent phosphoesterase TrpH